MNVEVTKLPESKVALTIHLTPDEVNGAMDRTYKQLVQRYNVPGFRRGKAPRAVVERMVGHELFIHEATEEAIRWGYRKAIDQENIIPIDEAEIGAHGEDEEDHAHLTADGAFSFEATVAIRPEVELPDYHALHIEREVVEPTDEDVNALLQELREGHITLEPTIRPLDYGDVATLNVTGKADGDEVLNTENAEFELRDEEKDGSDSLFPGLPRELLGTNRGDIKEVALALPESYGNPELAGKTLFLRMLVKEVKRKVLPDLDDDFAKSVGEFETLDDLKSTLRRNLEIQHRLEADEKLVKDAIAEVTSRTFIDIPPILIEEELDRAVDEMRSALESRGISLQSYIDMTGRSESEIRNEMREAATQNVKTSLVLGAVADTEGFEVSNADINAALDEMLRATNATSAQRREMRSSSTVRSNLRSRIRRQRAIRRLVEVMSDGEEVAPEAAEALADQTAAVAEDAEETVAVEVGG